MANPSALGAICYAPEASAALWGEDVTTINTLRLSVCAPVDASGLKHDKMDPKRVVQYRNDGTQFVLMAQGGSFRTKCYLTGHGSTTAGATTATGHETFLQYVFGNVAAFAAAGTTLTGGTATVPLTTASGTFSAGGMCRIGTLGDGRGNGQFYAIATHITTSLTLLTAMDGAPTNGDVLYSAVGQYTSENPTTVSVTGLRFLLQTANLCYECHGCYPTAVTIAGLSAGEVPTIEVTWGVSWWRHSTAPFPSAVATETFQPAPTAAGSLFMQNYGTATRQKFSVRNFSLSYKLGIEPLMGSGGFNQYQAVVGARRTPDDAEVRFTIDADAQTATPVLDALATGTTAQHILYTLNPTIGSSVGFYFPQVVVKQRSLQRADKNINRYDFVGDPIVSTTTTNDLTLSAFRMAFA